MAESNSNWHGRRVLVAGCTGFLGSAVVEELLAEGAEVVGLVRDRTSAATLAKHQLAGRVHIVYGRVEDLFRVHSALAVYEVNSLFHLIPAAPFGPDRGIATVLEAVRRYDPRVPTVVARPAISGSAVNAPVPLGVARFGELFGRDPKSQRFVASTTIGLLEGTRTATHSDRGERDFVHVRDAARACLLLGEALGNRPIPHVHEAQFRTGWVHGDREMLAALREGCAGRSPRAWFATPPANPLGWSPSLNFSDAIADTVEGYRESVRSRGLGTRAAQPARAA